MILSLLLSSVYRSKLAYSLQKLTALYNIPLENASTSLSSQLLMLKGKEMRNFYHELLQILWNF